MPIDYRIAGGVKVPEWTPNAVLQQDALNTETIKAKRQKHARSAALMTRGGLGSFLPRCTLSKSTRTMMLHRSFGINRRK